MTPNLSLLEKNIESILPSKELLAAKINHGKKLKIYLGIDPTSPEIHIGNAIALWKLKEFQNEGHTAILLVGDFTGMIGDPSDKSAIRKKMTRDEIVENSTKYKKQASKILEFGGKNPAKLEFNSDWLTKLSLEDMLELAGNFTVQQMIERDMFQARISDSKPIGLHEFLYPLLQGYDSVALDTDIEIGGTDQTFNMIVGRTLMKNIKNKEKFIITLPLLEGTDGRKMSKSYGNTIGVDEKPSEMYGKIMSLKDELIIRYFDLCTDYSKQKIDKIATQLQMKAINPMQAKKELAFAIVKRYHGTRSAEKAQGEFKSVFQEKKAPKSEIKVWPEDIKLKEINVDAVNILIKLDMVKSINEAKRLIEQGGVYINQKKVGSIKEKFSIETGTLAQIGRRKAVTVEIKGGK